MQLRFLYCIVYFERQLNESKYVNDIYAKFTCSKSHLFICFEFLILFHFI